MRGSTAIRSRHGQSVANDKMSLKYLVGSGDRIGLVVLPFLILGAALNVLYPTVFAVGGPAPTFQVVAWIGLAVGLVFWLWSVVLILTWVPKHGLITTGPFALMKHPLYTSVALLVVPSVGMLLNSWLGIGVGIVMYLASRRYSPEEERALADSFGHEWDAYADTVRMPWL
jgi:protein-S-isoprenylcysteine O-methyltransferase Ste14